MGVHECKTVYCKAKVKSPAFYSPTPGLWPTFGRCKRDALRKAIQPAVRFRGINTAGLIRDGVKTGKVPDRADQAKAFVEDRLKGIEFVVIKTCKTDMYGRYVADVFYHSTIKKKEEGYLKGFFLNLDLLQEGLVDFMN